MTSLKTLSMYLRAAKTEAEDAGESTDGMAESVSKLRDEILALTGNKVDLYDQNGDFKSTIQIMRELSSVWHELSDVSQANILERIGGKRNASVVASLLQNFQETEKALKVSQSAEGSALRENDKYLDSIQGRLDVLKATGQAIATDLLDPASVKIVMGFLQSVATGLEKITNALGGVPTALLGGGLFAMFKNLDSLRAIGDFQLGLSNVGKSLSSIEQISKNTLSGVPEAVRNTALAYSGLEEAGVRAALSALGLKDAELEEAVAAVMAQASTLGLSGAFDVLGAKIKAAAVGLWTFLTTNPIGWAILAATAIFGLAKAFDYANKAQDRAIERAQEAQDAYTDTAQKVDSLKSQLEGINDQISEINSKGTLSITDQETLRTLSAERQELERELAVQEKLAALRQSEAARTAHEALHTEKIDKRPLYVAVNSYGEAIVGNPVDFTSRDPMALAEAQQDALDTLQQQRSDFIAEYASKTDTLSKEEAERYNRGIEAYGKAIALQETALADTLDELRTQRLSLVNAVTGEAFAGYEADVERIDAILNRLVDTTAEVQQSSAAAATPSLAMSKNTRDQYKKYTAAQQDRSKSGRERVAQIDAAKQAYLDSLTADNAAISFSLNIEEESAGIEAVQSALKASTEAAGLNGNAIEELTSRYQVLKSFNPEALFQQTSNGVRLNSDEVSRLESELNKVKQTGFDEQLRVWTEQLSDVDQQIKTANNLSTDEVNALILTRAELINKINSAKDLATQYAALTSNYQQWINAQNAGEEGDMYDSIVGGYEKAKELFDKGLTGTNEFREYIELLSGKDLSTSSIREVTDEWERLSKVNKDTGFAPLNFLSTGSAGVENFISAIEKVRGEWATFDEETQTWHLNIESVDELASALGVDTELVEALLKKAGDYGVEVSAQTKDAFGNAITSVEDAMATLQSELDSRHIELNFDTTNLEQAENQFNNFKSYYDSLKENGKINLNSEEAQAAYTVMSQLFDLWQQLEHQDSLVYNVDTSSVTNASSVADQYLAALHNVAVAKQELEKRTKLGLDTTEAQSQLDDAVAKVNEVHDKLDPSKAQKLPVELDTSELTADKVDAALAAIDAKPEVLTKIGVSENLVEQYLKQPDNATEATITVKKNEVQEYLDDPNHLTKATIQPVETEFNRWLNGYHAVSVHVIPKPTNLNNDGGLQSFQGTAHATGAWGTKRNEVALTGELGREIVVEASTGRWHTVGDHGAEFANIPKGSIVFNHKQTEQLFKYGRINSRGKALAGGTAFLKGFEHLSEDARGTDVLGNKPGQQIAQAVDDTTKTVVKATETASDVVEDTADSVAEDTAQIQDWVETALSNIEKKTEKYLAKAEKKAEAGNYSGAARQYRKAENAYAKEMSKQKDAEAIYMAQANRELQKAISDGKISARQAASIQKKVANGSMELSKVSDSTKEVIDAYKEYYDKAVAAADATEEIYSKYQEVAEKLYQLPLDQAESKTGKLKDEYELLGKKLDVVYNKTTQVKLLEQQMANVRQQHSAQMQAYTQAHKNYLTAERKINESSDKALKGLSANVINAINEMVKAGETIDYTELIGLTDTAKLAIIDYNAALEAQSQALYDTTMAALDTTIQLRELSEEKYNKPNEDAEAESGKNDKTQSVLSAEYDVATTAAEKNAIVKKQDTEAKKDWIPFFNAWSETQGNMEAAWWNDAVQKALTTEANSGKQLGQTLNFSAAAKELGYKKGSEEYDALKQAVIEYNDAVNANRDATKNLSEATAVYQKELQDNAAQRVQNVIDEEQAKIDAKQGQIDNANAGMEQLGNVMNAINAASTQEEKDRLAKLFKEAYGWEIDPSKTYAENQAAGYDYIKTLNSQLVDAYGTAKKTVDAQINAEKDLTSEQRAEFQQISTGFSDAGIKASNAMIEAGQKFAEAVNESSPEKQGEREAQGRLDEANKNIDTKNAAGQVLTASDHQAIIDAINGYTDADGNRVQGLLDYKNADLQALEDQAETLIEGTDAWKENQEAQEALRNEINSLTRSAKDAANAIQQLGLDENTKKLEENAHNQAMLDAKNREASAMGQAIGGALGIDGGSLGNAISTIFELVGGGAAIGKGVVDAFNNPDGFSLSGLFESVSSSASEYARTSTQAGIREDERQILEERLQYLKDNPVAEGDEGYDEYIKEYRETEEKLANNAADAAEDVANAAQSAGGAMKDAVDEARKLISDLIHRQTNMIKLKLADIEYNLKKISSEMAMTEARGLETNYDQLIRQIKETEKEIAVYEKELIPQLEREERWTDDSEGDRSASEKLQDHQAVLDAKAQLEDLKLESFKLQRMALRDKVLDPLTKAHEEVERMKTTLEAIDGLLTDDMLFDAEGQISRNGQARLDMLLGEYRAAEAEIKNYQDDIEALNRMRLNGMYSDLEFDQMVAEAQQNLLDAEKDRVDLAMQYIDIIKQAGEEELDNLNEIIDARQKALDAKKDYYEYDKNIRAKTKDIQALQAQIAALEGLTDAESKAKKARLEADLSNAQDELKDMVQEHTFELAGESLDELRDTLEKAHEDEWKEITSDLEKLLGYVDNINASVTEDDIYGSAYKVLKTIGVQFANIDGKEVDATQFATMFQDALREELGDRYDDATLQEVFQIFRDEVFPRMKEAGLWHTEYTEGTTAEETALAASERTENTTPMDKPEEKKLSFWEWLKQLITDFINWCRDAFTNISTWFQNTFGNLGSWFSSLKDKLKIPGFAGGTRGAKKSGLAWTNENGKSEWIVRKSDGAILTPLAKGDGVLPADLTNKLYALAQGALPKMEMPEINLPDYSVMENYSPNITIDSSIHVEGSVDAAVISDLKKFRDETREDMYQFISEKMYRGYIHSGGKRRI